MDAFFELHRDLPREGPGEPADIAWASNLVDLKPAAQMADVACGPGGDIAALLAAAPDGHVTALDKTAHFVGAARDAWTNDGRVTVLKADMARIMNRYDMIWCAGAVYFLGVTQALTAWRKSLHPGGVIAFSEACWFTDTPSDRAKSYWDREYPAMTDASGIAAQVSDAGYEVLGTRRLADPAWEAYFAPLEARINLLRPMANARVQAVLDEAEEEISCWRAHRDDYGYLLSVVRPR
ncbi:methyltransferase domain-containing protein [Sulfitobacter sp. M57]|nr:methyltransferase domain-containing protein [Sulfitobacter sp. KE5]MDF3420778.1 methyltransferase domain-containing protein [Sulfitobacter sp. KE43]MDF3432487.1 methyltransferase domain-containing protein [Sulfitobacter sp. KE42]MDF3458126.1 methyltransferase domain-containing protein [Sulfitobacter sp. S74]MDF3462027.1 methyltransferase domain-containing protein [Sulfitobacter sp. Ks18]MDF3465928.1 methyltransferase domain-containing protein [Sulfitobacter sp. M05]MDF3469823.1 methyltrans